MIYLIAATTVLLLHLGFILFALFGALLALRWRRLIYLQLPAATWAVYIEMSSGSCPLTALENHFLMRAGRNGYAEGFVERYLLPVIYPAGLTPSIQWALAVVVVATNIVLYGYLLGRRQGSGRSPGQGPAP